MSRISLVFQRKWITGIVFVPIFSSRGRLVVNDESNEECLPSYFYRDTYSGWFSHKRLLDHWVSGGSAGLGGYIADYWEVVWIG